MKNSPFTIGVFISSYSIGEELKQFAKEQKDVFRLSYKSLEEAIVVGRQFEAEGVDVLISRRGTAHLLRENLHIPVLSFPQSSLSTLTSIKSATLQLVDSPAKKKKIFMPNFRNEISGLEILGDLLDIEFSQGVYYDSTSLRQIIFAAAEKGVEAVVGGATSMRFALECGLKFQELITPRENIIETIENAKSAALASREEKATAKRYQSIMDLASDAIFSIDGEGNFTTINRKARSMLGVEDVNVLGKPVSSILVNPTIRRMLEAKKAVQDKIEDFAGELCIYNQLPLTVKDQSVGVVATFKEISTVMRAENKVRRRLTRGFAAKYTLGDLIYQSQAMEKLVNMCREFAKTDSTILVMGETGTGKEVVAQSIHNLGQRKKMPFVSVHCGALPEQLLESELFGYEEGAFTGSKKGGKPGLFEIAHQGTIFLDEIDSTSMSVQLRLLRVLQEREVMRLGGDSKIPVEVRVIAAAGKDLWAAVQGGLFRKDLFFRLNVLRLTLPPLRTRTDDIPLLLGHFINYYAKKHGLGLLHLPEYYVAKLTRYSWPGNIRQLKHFAEQLLLNSSFQHSVDSLDSMFEDLCQIAEVREGENKDPGPASQDESFRLIDPASEAEIIRKALQKAEFSKTKAAKILGISRTTLWRKLQGLERTQNE